MEGISSQAPVQPGEINSRIAHQLKRKQVRYTKARRLVIRALQRAPGPQSASDLHRKLRTSVPLSSLYRTLSTLDEAGVLGRLHGPKGVARYELAEWLTGHHDHLVCVECGATEDIELANDLETSISGFARRLEGSSRFEVSGHSLQLEGTCEDCRR
ncbi:MAG: transcriptional repressor [Actinomycetota bacterium]|nr:transcriptional repressor [Actinomycetota bacterium]